jgi:hypothetical protein
MKPQCKTSRTNPVPLQRIAREKVLALPPRPVRHKPLRSPTRTNPAPLQRIAREEGCMLTQDRGTRNKFSEPEFLGHNGYGSTIWHVTNFFCRRKTQTSHKQPTGKGSSRGGKSISLNHEHNGTSTSPYLTQAYQARQDEVKDSAVVRN